MTPMIRFIPILLLSLALAGCNGGQRHVATDPASPASAARDLQLDLTVDGDRLVLFPNGALHHGAAASGEPDRLPPRIRFVTTDDMNAVWLAAADLERAAPDGAAASAEADTRIHVREGGARRMYLVASDSDAATRDAADRLVAVMRRLAWAEGEVATTNIETPKRYDFGPDPLERYR